jgi:hypothetical protein
MALMHPSESAPVGLVRAEVTGGLMLGEFGLRVPLNDLSFYVAASM